MLKTYQNPNFPLVGNVEWIHTPLVFLVLRTSSRVANGDSQGEKKEFHKYSKNKTLRPSSARPSMAPYDHCATRFRVNLNGQEGDGEKDPAPGWY
jgi:hypothetical protein